ncbi:MAG: phage portal protein [Deltaproteobacteria bacterium]|nr:MAG: phage portal protein [Deltaproteobacteria bacterium]
MANLIKKIQNTFSKALKLDPGRGEPVPRKGMFRFLNNTTGKKVQRQFTLSAATLGRLANTDPVTWAIRRVIKGFISQTKWDIVPDTDNLEAELDRWEESILTSLNPYGYDLPPFKSQILPEEIQDEIRSSLPPIIEKAIDEKAKREAVRWFFKAWAKRVKQNAEEHKYKVKCILEHPNQTETTFRTLLELVLDDILIYDSGVIVKNYDYLGNLAEIYPLPGQEVKIYRNEDRTIPKAPEPAYVWEDKGVIRAEFTNDELLYISQNPQQTGYGVSPLEVAAYIITASLYADEYNIDYFKNSNVPPGVLNLGENVSEDQRQMFQNLWEQEVQGRGGLHKLLITSGSDKLDFIPMRVQSNRDMQMMEYLKWTVAIKCAVYGISPQDIGFVLDFHRTTAEVQAKLSQARGVKTLLNLLASFFNEEIVKAEFGFQDVKFEWQSAELKDDIQQSQVDRLDMDSGVISINERRKKLGKKPIEGGDEQMIKTGVGMVPVKDIDKLDELGGMPNRGFQQNERTDPFGLQPGPEPEQQVDGDAGRPTMENAVPPSISDGTNTIKVSVNRKKKYKEQNKLVDKTVKELRKQGIDADLRIGFDEDDSG